MPRIRDGELATAATAQSVCTVSGEVVMSISIPVSGPSRSTVILFPFSCTVQPIDSSAPTNRRSPWTDRGFKLPTRTRPPQIAAMAKKYEAEL